MKGKSTIIEIIAAITETGSNTTLFWLMMQNLFPSRRAYKNEAETN